MVEGSLFMLSSGGVRLESKEVRGLTTMVWNRDEIEGDWTLKCAFRSKCRSSLEGSDKGWRQCGGSGRLHIRRQGRSSSRFRDRRLGWFDSWF